MFLRAFPRSRRTAYSRRSFAAATAAAPHQLNRMEPNFPHGVDNRAHGRVRHRLSGMLRFAFREISMSLLINVLITFVVIILVLYLVNILPIDGRAKQIVRVVVVVIGILSLLRYLSVF
jgi:hypothetical protein